MKVGLYSVTDKALFDALLQSKVTHENMKDLFFKRGVIVSKETPKKSLALEFSYYFHGFSDYEKLSGILGSVARREKNTSIIIIGDIVQKDIEHTLKETIKKTEDDGDKAKFIYVENGGLEVTINYVKLDYKLSEFRQVSNREAKILIEPLQNGKYQLRFPPNSKAKDFVNSFSEIIKKENKEKSISIDEITLESVKDAKQRTLFFKLLTSKISNYERLDVSDVYISHPAIELDKKSSVKPNHEDEDEDEDEDEEKMPVDTGYHISKAALKGRGVLESPELNNLLSKGFYITRIIWTAKIKDFVDSDKVEFEAQFIDSENCKTFSYLIRGYYKYKSKDEYSDTRSYYDKEKEKILSSYIEVSARDIAKEIVDKNILQPIDEPRE